MGKETGFLEIRRAGAPKEKPAARRKHWREIYREMAEDELRNQASRCMECGVPFCHSFGCPLGNVIPEWNELIYRGRWREAVDLLQSTNNFPEVTGRVCPALCEAACTLTLDDEAVTIRLNEKSIVERAWREGWIEPLPPAVETGKRVAVVGSGPAGLAAAQQLRRAGHEVVVYEAADAPGGLLRYGIPDFKLEKPVLERRLAQMREEGVLFECGVAAGEDLSASYLRKRYDAIALAVGAGVPRDLPVPGRELEGVHFALELLVQQNRRNAGLPVAEPAIDAAGKHVVIIGGGDTGADCVGTALRQGAASVTQLEILPRPPEQVNPQTPWPEYPNILRTNPSHEEGGERRWCVATEELVGEDGRVKELRGVEVEWQAPAAGGRPEMRKKAGSEFTLPADLVLLAMGFTQPRHQGLLDDLGVEYDSRGTVVVDERQRSSVADVYAAGDAATGAWLVVHAIAGGRRLARAVDEDLMGESDLPEPPPPVQR
jgi:glutamate synthase (NADPH/NADH) small chain